MDHSIRAPLPSGLADWVWPMEAGDEGQEARRPGIFCPCSLFSLQSLLATLLCGPSNCQAALPSSSSTGLPGHPFF